MYTRDWYMRQIELMVQFVAKVLFKKPIALKRCTDLFDLYEGGPGGKGGGEQENGGAELEGGSAESGSRTLALRRELAFMIEEGQINEAEDILFENLAEGDRDMLAVAVAFYVRLNQLEDFILASCAYTREEINEGLKDALRVYGATPDLLFRV